MNHFLIPPTFVLCVLSPHHLRQCPAQQVFISAHQLSGPGEEGFVSCRSGVLEIVSGGVLVCMTGILNIMTDLEPPESM